MSDLSLPSKSQVARLDMLRLVTFAAGGTFCVTFWWCLARALFA